MRELIYHGDLFDVLPTLQAQSVDACVTDPPYELAFMGKRWDASGVAFNPETWRAILRVLKPGAHLLAFGGTRTYHRMVCAIEDAGFEVRDCLQWIYGSGFPKSLNLGDGRGTALKPAYEPIVLCRKPCDGSTTKNVQTHGTGGLRIDDCRIGTDAGWEYPNGRGGDGWNGRASHRQNINEPIKAEAGRWPSNVLLDEDAAAMLDEQSGELIGAVSRSRPKSYSATSYQIGDSALQPAEYADSGGASRFFYVAKPSRAERDQGCQFIEARQRDDSRIDGNPGGDNPRNRGLSKRGNHHPTVKPVELMRYLVRLVTPVGGTVLDPFTGSGTTGMACRFEALEFIGIEQEAEYVEIAERRIASCLPLLSA